MNDDINKTVEDNNCLACIHCKKIKDYTSFIEYQCNLTKAYFDDSSTTTECIMFAKDNNDICLDASAIFGSILENCKEYEKSNPDEKEFISKFIDKVITPVQKDWKC